MPNMIFIPHSGEQRELEFEEMTDPILEYMNPDWQAIINYIGTSDLEHVSVLYGNKRAHMFVDEIGSLKTERFINVIASGIYWTNTIFNKRQHELIPIFGRAVLFPHGVFEEDNRNSH